MDIDGHICVSNVGGNSHGYVLVDKLFCLLFKRSLSIAVAPPTSIAQDNGHLWTSLPLHCYSNVILSLLLQNILFPTIHVDRQRCQPIVVNTSHRLNIFLGLLLL